MATLDGSDQDWVEDFKARFDESNKQALVAALGFDPDDITREQLAEAYEITSLLLDDAESRDMLGRFAVDYTQAQDSTELSYVAGGLVFETVLAIVLVARGGELDGQLGRAGSDGQVRYWATTLDQVEPSDTCPRLIAQQLGVEYDPGASYRLAIIDREVALERADAETIIPTFDNLAGFIEGKLPNKSFSPQTVREVMTPGYQERYRKLVEGMGDHEWKSQKARAAYLSEQGLDVGEVKAFETRIKIQNETGANHYFVGNGLTRHADLSNGNETVFGAVETFTLEKNPQTFRTMTNGGQGGPDAYVELVDLAPIEFGD